VIGGPFGVRTIYPSQLGSSPNMSLAPQSGSAATRPIMRNTHAMLLCVTGW